MTLEDAVVVEEPEADTELIPALAAAEPFQIRVRVTSGRCEMVLSGELDVSTAPLLRHRMAEVTGELETELVLDISGLTFIDSTGLSLLVSEHKKLKAQGAELVVRSPTRMAIRLFELSGLDPILSIRAEGDDI
jgi:anti-sigma B factor antagonist